MPVLTPDTFTFELVTSKKDASGNDIPVVKADGAEKYVIAIRTVAWDGGAYDKDIRCKATFSDGRNPVEFIVPYDVLYELEVTSTVARIIEVTLIDKTPGSDYSTTKNIQFS